MQDINLIQIVLLFVGGFGLFIFGMNYMGEGLQKAAGSRMKNLIGALTEKPIMGVGVGALATAIIQSSSASTVMVVGFVNAGLMSLRQAVGVIMGANIGTTVTAWIVALGDWVAFLKPSTIAPLCIGIGVGMTMFANKQNTKQIGQIVFGFGALFLGLDLMSDAVKPLRDLPQIKTMFVTLGANPILGILTGAAVTALIQSSSASVGILQTMAMASLIPWNAAIYIILGQNIGTCITAALSGIGASKNGKRAAMIHFIFNMMGSIIFATIAFIGFEFFVPDLGAQLITATQISIAHTVFNVLGTLVLFPFAGTIVAIAERLITGEEDKSESELQHLDERILESPSFAVQNATKEVVRMGDVANQNLRLAVDALLKKDEEKIKEVFEREKVINELQHGINNYLVRLSNTPLSEKEQKILTGLFHSVTDIERVGDHADNIAELAQNLIEDDMEFSDLARQDLKEMSSITLKGFKLAMEAYEFEDYSRAKQVPPIEKSVDNMEKRLRASHIKRLKEKKCSALSGVVFLDVVSNLERISDHSANLAMTVLDEQSDKVPARVATQN